MKDPEDEAFEELAMKQGAWWLAQTIAHMDVHSHPAEFAHLHRNDVLEEVGFGVGDQVQSAVWSGHSSKFCNIYQRNEEMNDRELLELAAKAAGWTGWKSKHGYWNVESPDGEKTTHCHSWYAYCPNTGEKLKEPTFADAIEDTNWNPLIDDGDALRLAVKLKMKLEHYSVTTEGKDRVARK
jgi:hypothetical protein